MPMTKIRVSLCCFVLFCILRGRSIPTHTKAITQPTWIIYLLTCTPHMRVCTHTLANRKAFSRTRQASRARPTLLRFASKVALLPLSIFFFTFFYHSDRASLRKNLPVNPPSSAFFIWVSMNGVRAPSSGVRVPLCDVMSVSQYPDGDVGGGGGGGDGGGCVCECVCEWLTTKPPSNLSTRGGGGEAQQGCACGVGGAGEGHDQEMPCVYAYIVVVWYAQ